MGGVQSSPINVRNYSVSTGTRTVHLRHTGNNNIPEFPITRTLRRKSSILTQGWNFAKKTANSVLPNVIQSGSSEVSNKKKNEKSFRSLNPSRSQSSILSPLSEDLDDNFNYVSEPIKPLKPLKSENSTLYANHLRLEPEFCRKTSSNEDIKNNNNWSYNLSPPQGLQRILTKFGQSKSDKRCSLSTSSSATSSTASTESAQSFTLVSQSNFQSSLLPSSESSYSCISDQGYCDKNDIIHSSTAELLLGLGKFVAKKCRVSQFEPAQLVMWLRSIDRSLMLQGWQDVAFVNPANLVFVYFLVREQLEKEVDDIRTTTELQSLIRTCLYVSYSYLGNEISYPLKPFISATENRRKFWNRCIQLINEHSEDMLRLNTSTTFFLDMFSELRTYACLPVF
ncbi:unnamed protein product [Bursaphelenchus xylophilus]|uniref:(pine wood nematode) hypothetical protein n=1 Tax=Bursaphelenchus xylophilus TaxID=6326 RepID=A0A1I7STU3_BURXY|nr:unnamed protein product [Bursaphelenchus xylophilus]CAG9107960.1 unnamed protein product [Bursaphelenchus xylophilus]